MYIHNAYLYTGLYTEGYLGINIRGKPCIGQASHPEGVETLLLYKLYCT